MAQQLAKLVKMSFNDGWNDERAFSKWLGETPEGLKLLADALEVDDLELVGLEKQVGRYSADVVLREIDNDKNVIVVENQRGATDHDHLGKMLTYATALNARQIVWIAEEFTDEHRAVLDWLNQITGNEIGFTGLEIELWKISDSTPAPQLKIVSHVNAWSRAVKPGESVSQILQNEYWVALKEHFVKNESSFRIGKPTYVSWFTFKAGATFCWYGVSIPSTKPTCTYLTFHGRHINGIAVVNFIEDRYGAQIKSALQKFGEVEFRRVGQRWQAGEIRVTKAESQLKDKCRWVEYHQWHHATLERFGEIFKPIISEINSDDFPPQPIGEDDDENSGD